MAEAKPAALDIALAPERLDEGSVEESAAFGLFSIRAGNATLTEGLDSFIGALRPGPLVSGYHAAEWFAWNWWRLRYEPYSSRSADWWRAHRMTAIGEGYMWPNVTFRTDGVRAAVLSAPSSNPEARPFRFVGGQSWLGPSLLLEEAIDSFIPRILARLREHQLGTTNLDRIWSDVLAERRDPLMTERRRLEALLGRDPDEVEDGVIQGLLTDGAQLGAAAVEELAADAAGSTPPRATALRDIAKSEGVEGRRGDAARLPPAALTAARREPRAWQQGRHAARKLRANEGMGVASISTLRLSQLLGTSTNVQDAALRSSSLSFSFLLNYRGGSTRVVLRSRWDTGQRFELARLLGDHLLFGRDVPMLPATRAYTFRQKAQRAFAAEFLSPFEAVEDMLRGDFSQEAIEVVAEHFTVSTLTIETLLWNNDRIEREPTADAA